MDMQVLMSDLVSKLLELLGDLDRASESATHVSADGNRALGGDLSAVMREETHHVLDHPSRFTDLTGDPRDIDIADIPLPMLYILQHLGDSGSDLSFNERFHGLSFQRVDDIKKLLLKIFWIEKTGSLVRHLLSPRPHACGKIPVLGFGSEGDRPGDFLFAEGLICKCPLHGRLPRVSLGYGKRELSVPSFLDRLDLIGRYDRVLAMDDRFENL